MLLVISPKTNGMIEASIEATIIISVSYTAESGYAYACNESYADSYSTSFEGPTISYNGEYAWDWMLTCTGAATPSSFMIDLDGELNYATTHMTSEDAMKAELTVSNLDEQSPNFIINETYVRSGTQVSKVRGERTFSSTITVITKDLTISKETQLITAGEAQIKLEGLSSTGNTFTYSGTLIFNGAQNATLTISGGNTYDLSW